jgi:transcription antitermination factor NusA-like protein
MDLTPKTPEEHLEDFLATKEKIRKELRELPFPEKIRRVIEMQKIARALNPNAFRKII